METKSCQCFSQFGELGKVHSKLKWSRSEVCIQPFQPGHAFLHHGSLVCVWLLAHDLRHNHVCPKARKIADTRVSLTAIRTSSMTDMEMAATASLQRCHRMTKMVYEFESDAQLLSRQSAQSCTRQVVDTFSRRPLSFQRSVGEHQPIRGG